MHQIASARANEIPAFTGRRLSEEDLRRAQAELARLTRITILGELAASTAHEIKQPLTAIAANAEAALATLHAGSADLGTVGEALADILKDSKRARDVVQRIQQHATKREAQKKPVNLNDIVEDALFLMHSELIRHGAAVRVLLAPSLPPVLCDCVQLRQVMINLVMNALEAMAGVHDRIRELRIRSEPVDDGWVLVAVQDTGTGLDPNSADCLFESFFTTKPESTGLGLSVSRSIIEGHCGRLWASSNPHFGATFQFKLPILIEPRAAEYESGNGVGATLKNWA